MRGRGCGLGAIFVVALWVAAIGGWVSNIVKVIGIAQQDRPVTTMFIVRCIGIPVAPLGVVLGYVD